MFFTLFYCLDNCANYVIYSYIFCPTNPYFIFKFSGYQELLLESSFIFSRLGVTTGFEAFVVTWLDQLLGQCVGFLKMAAADFAGYNES